jgi:predicted transport protein
MPPSWKCPKCQRAFTRKNQRHACGTGERADVLRNRSPELVRLFALVEAFAKSLGPIEVVTRERYVLFRSLRIFADLVVMTDALRIAIHLGRKVAAPIFFKVVSDERKVSHVAKLRTEQDFAALKPLLKEAYTFSLAPRPPAR